MINLIINLDEQISAIRNEVADKLGVEIEFLDSDGNLCEYGSLFNEICSRKPYSNELMFFDFARLNEITKKFQDSYGVKAIIYSPDGIEIDQTMNLSKYKELYKEVQPTESDAEEKSAPSIKVPVQEEVNNESIIELEKKEKRAYSFSDFLALAEEAFELIGDSPKTVELYKKAQEKIFIMSDFEKLLNSIAKKLGNYELALDIAEKARKKAIMNSDIEFLDNFIEEAIGLQNESAAMPSPEVAVIDENEPEEFIVEETPTIAEETTEPEDYHDAEVIAEELIEAQDENIESVSELEEEAVIEIGAEEPIPEEAQEVEISDDAAKIPEDEVIRIDTPADDTKKEELKIEFSEENENIKVEYGEQHFEYVSEETSAYNISDDKKSDDFVVDKDIEERAIREESEYRTFEEYRHLAADAKLKGGNKNDAIRYFKLAGTQAKTFDEIFLLGQSIFTTVNDPDWSRVICEEAEYSAKTFDDYFDLAEFIMKAYNDKNWAMKVLGKAKNQATDFEDFNRLGEFVSKQMKDDATAMRLFKNAMSMSGSKSSHTSKSTHTTTKTYKKSYKKKKDTKATKIIVYIVMFVIVMTLMRLCD